MEKANVEKKSTISEKISIFFTSDWHLGHANAIRLDNRPFRDLKHMHQVLINNYNSTVPKNGVCYFLGDIGQGDKAVLRDLIGQLNGTKICVLGNHDSGVNSMYNLGFDVVLNSAIIYVAGARVTLSHCPLRGVFREDVTGMKGGCDGDNWHGEHKHRPLSVTDEGQFHLHGHIHSPNGGKSEKILGRQRDVGVPANGYRPVSISEIESWIAKFGR